MQRIKKLSRLRACLLVVLLMAMFVAGIVFHRYKPFPYEQLKSIKDTILHRGSEKDPPGFGLRELYTFDKVAADINREIDSALVPLQLRGLRLSDEFNFPKRGGGMTLVGNLVVVMDRLGGIYVFDGTEVRNADFPKVPNNITEFVAAGRSSDIGGFRVHDICYDIGSQMLFASYEYYDAELGYTRLALTGIKIDPNRVSPMGSWQTVYLSEPVIVERYAGEAGGGRMVPIGEGKILMTVGDYNQDGVMSSEELIPQQDGSGLGRIIEIDLQHKAWREISRGHRNPQGLVTTVEGVTYATEHGPAGGDELNIIEEGENYGWPVVTFGTDYDTYSWPHESGEGRHRGYKAPLYSWVPSIGVSNLMELTGFNPKWNGDLLVSSLKAASLFRLRLVEGRVVYSEPIWIGERIRDLTQLPGTIVLFTDDSKLLFLSVDTEKLAKDERKMGYLGDTAFSKCTACHHFGKTNPTHLAPSLLGVLGRPFASDDFGRYSAGLSSIKGEWNEESLRAYLSNPSQFAPGSTMPNLNLSETEISEIIDRLSELK